MDDQVVRDLVAMGKFLGSLDGVGVAAPVLARANRPPATPPFAKASPARLEVRGPRLQVGATTDVATSLGPAVSTPSTTPAVPMRAESEAPAPDTASVEAALKAIREDIGDCKRCRLCEGRTKIVFGQGSSDARLLFVGEAPGADEDASGLAFVGRAGQLLTDMIEKGMKLKREDVFIANVIKCRPPGNRAPETDEVLACQGFLEAQIKALKPRAIVALGATAGKFMAKSGDPISRLRGRFASWDGIPVMPTFHPAYLLRNPSAKKDVWADLKLVMDVLGLRSE